MSRPVLIVVSGPPGAGKTTLAHALAREIGCPAICRDEIKEGMAATTPGFETGPGDDLSLRTLAVFFEVLEVLLRSGVTVVAEAAFQDRLWRPGLERLAPLADIRIVHCRARAEVGEERRKRRAAENPRHRRVHGEAPAGLVHAFQPVTIDAPALEVNTDDGYVPPLEAIARFALGGSAGS